MEMRCTALITKHGSPACGRMARIFHPLLLPSSLTTVAKNGSCQSLTDKPLRAITMSDISSLDLKQVKIKIKTKPSPVNLSPDHSKPACRPQGGMAGESGSADMRKCQLSSLSPRSQTSSHKPSFSREHFKCGTEFL